MADQKLLTQTLPEFASTLVRDLTIGDVLHDLAERAAAVAGADSAGVSLRHSGRLRFAAALDEDSSDPGAGAGKRASRAVRRRAAVR